MLTQLGAAEIGELLRGRKASVKEVLEAHLQRIAALDDQYGAFITLDEEEAWQAAERAQGLWDTGQAGPLTGVPVAIKDNISTQGVRTTCGSRMLEGYVPPFDATVVQRLKAAGMVPLGKTNLDEFAMGTSCENSALLTSRNPWDPDRCPGGSSGGSAVAVSAEMAPLALGSDTGGSVRMPAALCGIVGFKPTYGRVSRFGLVAFASSLDQIGPMARSVEDAALLANVVSGPDHRDSTSLPLPPVSVENLKTGKLAGLKAAVPREVLTDAVQPGVREAFDTALEALQREGVDIRSMDFPTIAKGVTTYYIIAPAEASSNLARFDGIRYGSQVQADGHVDMVGATRGKLFGREVKLRIMVGTYALSAGYYDAYYHRAQQVRGLMSAEFERAFSEVDVVLTPTSPVVAFKFGELNGDPMALKLLDLCTIPANMGGFPSISLPCGLSQGLPVGICLTGRAHDDEGLLRIAHAFEAALPWRGRRAPVP